MTQLPVFNGFWNGFQNPDNGIPTPLDQTPGYVNTVTLAFAGTASNSGFTTDYLCKYYSKSQIIAWVRMLQSRGQKVLMSIIDNDQNHWNTIDVGLFVKNATDEIIGDWGLDGIDIDGESMGSSAEIFIEVISKFRSALGPVSAGKILTYDTYLFSEDDQAILSATKDDLNWVNLMAYFLETDTMIELFTNYAQLMGPEKVAIGVKPGNGQGDQSTPVDEVIVLAKYQPAGAKNKRGMMLYALTRDIPFYTSQPPWTWTEAINNNLF